jgi:hypothetical protein
MIILFMRHALISFREHRLLHKKDFGQFTRDLQRFHMDGKISAKDPIGTMGALVVTPVVAAANGIGAAVRSVLSSQPPVPLRNGPLKYTGQGARMLGQDIGALGNDLLHFRPVEALKDVVNIVLDIPDLAVRPAVDVVSDAFGHINTGRTVASQMHGVRNQVSTAAHPHVSLAL